MQPIHGGDVESYRIEYGTQPLDFSSNGNPLGMPKAARKAIVSAVKNASSYPDPYCRALRDAIAEAHGVNPEHVLCGNGAADIIYRLALALRPKTALIPAPTFLEYEAALSVVQTEVKHHRLLREEGYQVTERILDDITPELGIVYLCNPNNPTGTLVDPKLLKKIVKRCTECGTLLIIDECFLGFVQDGKKRSLRHLVAKNQGVIILDAFTKLYAMAGVRLGYCICSNAELLDKIAEAGQPWSVSLLAQAAGVAALEGNRAYLKKTRKLVATERAWLYGKLEKLGLEVFEGQADYLFFISEHTDLAAKLRERGILIRDCSNYVGLEPGAYRVAVRTHKDNARLIRALKRALSQEE